MITLQDYETNCNEHRGVIILHRGQHLKSGFQQDLEQGGWSHEDLTKPAAACIIRELRDHFRERGFRVIALDLVSGDLEIESDFFGLKLTNSLKFSYFSKTRWETVKLCETRTPIESDDQECPRVTNNPDQMTLFRVGGEKNESYR